MNVKYIYLKQFYRTVQFKRTIFSNLMMPMEDF